MLALYVIILCVAETFQVQKMIEYFEDTWNTSDMYKMCSVLFTVIYQMCSLFRAICLALEHYEHTYHVEHQHYALDDNLQCIRILFYILNTYASGVFTVHRNLQSWQYRISKVSVMAYL